MKWSINQLNRELEAIATAHEQINSYYWKDFLRAISEEVVTYPMMNAYYPTGTMLDNTTPIDLYIVISDKVYKDNSNLNDTESDTLQVLRDVYNIINRSTRWNRIGKVNSAVIDKFIQRGKDEVAGHILKINFRLNDSNSICNIPLDGYDFDGNVVSTCEPVLIFENDVLVDTIPSGGVYSYTSTTCEDATVTNSDNSYTDTVTSGGTLVLPDTTIDFYANNILQQSVTFATLSSQTINITN